MSASHDKVRDLAYQLWQEAGCPEGQDMDHWLQAESIVAADEALRVVPLIEAAAPKAVKAKAPAKPKADPKPKAAAKAKPAAKPKA